MVTFLTPFISAPRASVISRKPWQPLLKIPIHGVYQNNQKSHRCLRGTYSCAQVRSYLTHLQSQPLSWGDGSYSHRQSIGSQLACLPPRPSRMYSLLSTTAKSPGFAYLHSTAPPVGEVRQVPLRKKRRACPCHLPWRKIMPSSWASLSWEGPEMGHDVNTSQWHALSASWLCEASQTQPQSWLRAISERNMPFTVEATVVFPTGKGNQREILTHLLCAHLWVGSGHWWPWQLSHHQPRWFSLQQALHRHAAEGNLWSRGGRFDGGELNEKDYGAVERHLEV